MRVAGGAVCDDGSGGGGGDGVTVMSDAVVRVEGCLSDDWRCDSVCVCVCVCVCV